MKKATLFVLVLLMVAGISSCEKTKDTINEATEFNIDYSTNLSIPSTSVSVSVPADFTTPEVSTQSVSKFASEKTTQDLIDEIKLTRFNISNPSGNLDFLDSVSIYIKTGSVGDILVATKSRIPKGTTQVAADLKNVNIKSHISKEKIQFRVSVKITTGLSSNQQLKMDQTVRVKGRKVS